MVAFTTPSTVPAAERNPDFWFAFSASHGWVVLDRSLPCNRTTTVPEELLFTRCRDGKQYLQGDQPWNYREAARYLRSLSPDRRFQAEQELETVMEEWEVASFQ